MSKRRIAWCACVNVSMRTLMAVLAALWWLSTSGSKETGARSRHVCRDRPERSVRTEHFRRSVAKLPRRRAVVRLC